MYLIVQKVDTMKLLHLHDLLIIMQLTANDVNVTIY